MAKSPTFAFVSAFNAKGLWSLLSFSSGALVLLSGEPSPKVVPDGRPAAVKLFMILDLSPAW